MFVHSIHKSFKCGIFLDLSTIRITSFSHMTVGSVFARRSISLFVFVIDETLASCGILFSSGLICQDSILNFEIMLSCMFLGYCTNSSNIQSILILILQ